MFNERWQGWKKKSRWSPHKHKNITNLSEDQLYEWLKDVDCYATPLLNKLREEDFIQKVLAELKEISIVEGDPTTQHPNQIIVDITHLKPDGFQPTKTVLTTLAHFIRPCLCNDCVHTRQYECYLNDCECCTGECT